jgi:CheY-like chemotaxis protein/predicted Ser/Thr protein kinase
MDARLIVVARDGQYGSWLKHRIEASQGNLTVETIDFDEFGRRRVSMTRRDCDLLVMVAPFAAEIADAGCEGSDWLRRLREQPGFPPIVAIAEDGNEIAAVRALRLGAADYLPRRLLTPERLKLSIGEALKALRRAPPRPRGRANGQAHAHGGNGKAANGHARPVAHDEPAPSPGAQPLPRDLIPRYTLLQKLGESERSVVYLAASAALGRNVALKITRSNAGEEDTNYAHEYAAIGALSHPSIVDIYDYGVHDGREYLAMEYFPCGDLKARLHHPISEQESIDYLRRIARALCIVHGAGLVHRDLKPPNVMLRENGEVVLIDFGLAKSLTSTTRSTAAGLLRGSPYYMSPEQAQGVQLDVRSDLYSLGVILFEMLTGSKPYVGSTAMDVLQQHVAGPLPLLPRDLAHRQDLLTTLMAKSRDERFPSAEVLLDALQAT